MTPYFFSWTKQSQTVDFPVQSVTQDEFVLEDGRRVFDFISTSFQANFGHQFAPIQERISEQLATMSIASPKARFQLKDRASSKLLELLRLPSGKVFYTVSGAESVENALKIARQFTGRLIVAARQRSYHGASLGALSVTGDWRNEHHRTWADATLRIPDHDEDPDLYRTRALFEQAGTEKIAAVILETISGTNGMSIPPTDWMRRLQDLCHEIGALLILDEVLVGFGRCGSFFAFHEYDVRPDLVCLSKAISGGYVPFGAVWTSPNVSRYYDDQTLACGLTNYAHPLGLAALEAVIDTLVDHDFDRQKRELEDRFAAAIALVTDNPRVVETRCRGLMAAIYLDCPAPTWQAAFDRGLHWFSKDNYIILAPPYITAPERLTDAFSVLNDLLETAIPETTN